MTADKKLTTGETAVQQIEITRQFTGDRFGVDQSIAIAQVYATLAVAEALAKK